jgi:hypothetical protein
MSVSEDLDYQETIALLQDEVVRLENELRSRDEADQGPAEPAPVDAAAEEAAGRRVASLMTELANREETINLLLEQARLFEEAESADRANWEQLNHWVQELEQRVESGGSAGAVRDAVEGERRKAESERQAFEAERRSWEAERTALASESEKLRAMLSQAAKQPDAAGDAVLKALEKENRRLRSATSELARLSAAAAEAESLRAQVEADKDELARIRREQQQAADDLQRERKEHEAIIAGLRSQTARDSLKRQEEQVKAAVSADSGNLSPDERIRAFRMHLKEIHEKEELDRAQKRLSSRLSRLWRNTGPRG